MTATFPWRVSALAVAVSVVVAAGATGDLRLRHAVVGDDAQPGLAADVAGIRGRTFARVPEPVRAPATLRDVLADVAVAEVLDDRRLAARGRAWEAVGLGRDDAPRRLWRLVARDVDRVAYDRSEGRLFVDPSVLTVRDFVPSEEGAAPTILQMTGTRPDEPLLAHVLMHAMQDQRGFGHPLAQTTDALLGRAAFRESEANLVAVYIRFRGLGVAGDILTEGIAPEILRQAGLMPSEFEAAEGVVRRLAEFVYVDALGRLTDHLRAGGWGAVDRMADVAGTHRWLHQEPAAPGEDAAARPDVPPTSNPDAPTPAPPGLVRVDIDVLGPIAVRAMLAHGSGREGAADAVARAWRGDRMTRFESADGTRHVTRWDLRFEDGPSAAAFERLVGEILGLRFPDAERTSRESGLRVVSGSAGYRVTRTGNAVVYEVESVPGR